MRTIIILEDVTLTATEKTIREYEAELAEAQERLAEMETGVSTQTFIKISME